MSRCCSSARSTGRSPSPSARRCGTRAARSSARGRSACRSTPSAIEDVLRRQPAFRHLVGTGAAGRRRGGSRPRSSQRAARRRSGTRWTRSSSRSGRAPRRRLPMLSSSSARRSRSRARRGRSSPASTQGLAALRRARPSEPRPRRTATSAIPAFELAGLSTVDSVDTSAGRLGLVLLLGGAEPGNYGVDETADDGVLPPIPPLPAQGERAGSRVLLAARDEEERIGATVEALRAQLPRRRDRGRRRRLARRHRRPCRGGRSPRDPAPAPWQGPGADAGRAAASSPARSCSATPISRRSSSRSLRRATDLAIAAFRRQRGRRRRPRESGRPRR